jgi:hypothetical protein
VFLDCLVVANATAYDGYDIDTLLRENKETTMTGNYEKYGAGGLRPPANAGLSSFTETILFGITLLVGIAFCAFLIALVTYLASRVDLSDPWATVPAVMSFVVSVGYSLFVFKSKQQPLYGFVEVCFACAMAAHFAYRLARGVDEYDQKTLAVWIGIAGACYVVARGFSNMADAKKKLARARRLKQGGPQK